jgi:hypothetical protein
MRLLRNGALRRGGMRTIVGRWHDLRAPYLRFILLGNPRTLMTRTIYDDVTYLIPTPHGRKYTLRYFVTTGTPLS